MTLAELAAYITAKIGQTDATSVSICKDFLKRRYSMIWDAYDWQDTKITSAPTTTNGVAEIAMPSNTERVIAIRGPNGMLDPITSTEVIGFDPTSFERSGVPVYYEEWTDAANSDAKKIRLLPVPNAVYTLKVIGKRTMPALTDSTSSIIRNIDNCLIAFGMADMLQRQRQYAKAKEMVAEGAALLEAAKKLEQEQASKPRQSGNLTVAGDSLSEMANAVAARTGKWSPEDFVLIKDCLRRNYRTVWDSCLWRESQIVSSESSDGEFLILPEYFDTVLKVRGNADLGALDGVDLSYYFAINPQIFEQTATDPLAFSIVPSVAITRLPATAEQFKFVSSGATDKTPIKVFGEDASGNQVGETITLNGTTVVTSVNTYALALTIAKQITVGTVTVTGNVSAVTYQTLPPDERERKHMRLWVQPSNPGVAATCLILGKRRIRPLVSDEDTPLLRGIGNLLIAMSVADVTKDAKERERADDLYKTMLDKERNQTGIVSRVVPTVECSAYDPYYADYSFLPKG